jgi:hypothetical protein
MRLRALATLAVALPLLALLSAPGPARACDPAGRLDLFGLADEAPLVLVATVDATHRVRVLHALKGGPPRAMRLRMDQGDCNPRVEPGGTYLLFVRPDGLPVGAFESARPLAAASAEAARAAPLVVALTRWLAERDVDARRRMLVELLRSGRGEVARDAARTLSTSFAWAHAPGHSLGAFTPADCAALRAARDVTDPAFADRATEVDRLFARCR